MKLITEVLLLFALHYGNSLQAIPEAPILPDLDYRSLPEFVRKYLPTEQTISRSNSVYDDIPKTYGMSIKNDNGIVWNDLSSKSRYQVGNSQNSRSGREIDDIVDDMINEIYNHPTTHKSKQPNTTPTSVTEIATTAVVDTTTGHPVDQNAGNIPKTDPKFNGDQNTNIVSTTVVKNTTSNDINQSISNPTGEATSIDKMTVKDELNEIEKKLDAIIMNISQSMQFPKNTGSLNDYSNASMDQEKNNPDHKAAPSTLELLLQDDEIWSWLSSAISKYLEILMNRMGTLVKEQVDELTKSYFETHQCGSCPMNGTNVKFVDNETPEDLSKKHKETQPETENKDKFGNKYEKSTLYGNSVGNERVTNVFIFQMNGKNNGEPIITVNNSSGSYNIDYNNNTTTDNEDKNEKDIEATTVSTINTGNDTDADDSDKGAKEKTKHKGKHSDSKDSKKPKESESEDEEKGSVANSKKSKNTKKDSDSKKSTLSDKDDEKDSDAKDTKKSKESKKDKDNGTKDSKKSKENKKEKVSDTKDTNESKESGEIEEKESDSKESKKTEKEKDSDSKDVKKTKESAEDEENDSKETKKGKKDKDSDAKDSKELKESEEDEEKDSDAKDSKKSKKSKKEKESEDDEVKDSDEKDTKKTKKSKKDKDVTDEDASVEKSSSKEDDSGKDSAETTTEASKKDDDSGSSSHEDD